MDRNVKQKVDALISAVVLCSIYCILCTHSYCITVGTAAGSATVHGQAKKLSRLQYDYGVSMYALVLRYRRDSAGIAAGQQRTLVS